MYKEEYRLGGSDDDDDEEVRRPRCRCAGHNVVVVASPEVEG